MPRSKPVAIIDIGSNSVRLVVYAAATRAPLVLFNEKVMAGLGRDLAESGELPEEAQARALAALERFRILTRQMGVGRVRVVATAAVRDAANGRAFLKAVKATGFDPEVLSGEQEGRMAGLGVLSAIPEADGIVADLGGGSLELVEVAGGEIGDSVSLPLGVLRTEPLFEQGAEVLERHARRALQRADFGKRAAKRRPLYLVGGSWRALAHLDMALEAHPLPITHHHRMPPGRPAELGRDIAALIESGEKLAMVSSSRRSMLPTATLLLDALCQAMRPSELIVSAYGIREGLLYEALGPRVRARDPLIEAVRQAGRGLGRFAEHGALIDRWIAPAFDDPPEMARLRLAACLLSDVAWAAHPDFRAERGMEIALHGNWVGIDIPGRVMLAQALFTNFGGGRAFEALPFAPLCDADALGRAAQWGLAMRLAHRLSGGVAESLRRSRLKVAGETLRLEVATGDLAILGEPVMRRLKTLAGALGLDFEAGAR